ncbi:MAG: DUF1588 domain-containing protein [Polyangiaceae bacterium]|nr:DUF1588 domain-containing protein [Polyangiaceae bacterium]
MAPGFKGFVCDGTESKALGPRRAWRLNPTEYANTVTAALVGRRSSAQPLPAVAANFANPLTQADTRYSTESGLTTVSDAEFRASWTSTAEIAKQMVGAVGGTCWGATKDAACAGTLLQEKGSILFRRPLAADEQAHYVKIFTDALAGDPAQSVPGVPVEEALEIAFQSLLLAPQFVFKPELGAATGTAGEYQLTSHEVSQMLAYTLTEAPPDAELWAAAEQGMLTTPEAIKAQVVRIMASPGAYGARNFVTEYFKLRGITGVAKAADMGEASPCKYDKGRLVMQAEALVDDVYTNKANGGFIQALFTTADTFVDCTSESILGLTGAPQTSAPLAKMAAPAGQRAGFLTSPAWLGQMATRDDTKPVRRGLFMNEDVLCREIPAVPIDGVPPLGDTTDLTMREKLAVHASFNASCMPCHSLLDEPGLAFEKYDTLGTFRTTHVGKTVDASGTLVGVDDASVAFTDGVDLSTKLGGTTRIQECVMRNGFRYFLGRNETEADQCSLKAAKDAYGTAGSYVEFVSSLATSPSFLKRSF